MQPVRLAVALLSLLCASLFAQAPQQAVSAATAPLLAQVEEAAQTSGADLARLRIDKWKTDTSQKQQAQSNAESLQRNLSSALPALIAQARTNPNDVTALFRLYRNIGAIYDVLSNVAEATGAFGPKQDYEELARHVDQFDQARRNLGDVIEQAAERQSADLRALRTAAAQAQSAAAQAPPKKIIVDNSAPAASAKTAKKKIMRKKKPTTTQLPPTTPERWFHR